MEILILYFKELSDLHRIAFLAGITFFIWNIELVMPLYHHSHKWKHGSYNLLFVLIILPVQYVMGFFINTMLLVVENHHLGLLNISWFEGYLLLIFIIGFVLLDLGEYIYHRFMHGLNGLWLFHAVHHMEEDVDVSSTLREHPMETFIRLAFTVLWILLIGIPIWVLALRQFIQILFNLFSHSNFRLPKKLNAIVSIMFITPNLHHVHHHFELPYTNKNYGDVLSLWDKLFGTFYNGDIDIKYGVDAFQHNKQKQKISYLFLMPFRSIIYSKSLSKKQGS